MLRLLTDVNPVRGFCLTVTLASPLVLTWSGPVNETVLGSL